MNQLIAEKESLRYELAKKPTVITEVIHHETPVPVIPVVGPVLPSQAVVHTSPLKTIPEVSRVSNTTVFENLTLSPRSPGTAQNVIVTNSHRISSKDGGSVSNSRTRTTPKLVITGEKTQQRSSVGRYASSLGSASNKSVQGPTNVIPSTSVIHPHLNRSTLKK